jgi:hypothetical protein
MKFANASKLDRKSGPVGPYNFEMGSENRICTQPW